ncbi:secreted protein, partial [Bisporella sp. PMI_857]
PVLARADPDAPNPNDIYINKFTYAGSGCPAGSVANSTDASKQVLTLLFDQYVASIGPGTKVADRRKNCAVSLDIHYPQGYQYSIFSADYRGYADLDKGVTGEQQSTYYFSGQQQQFKAKTTWKGEYRADYLLTDKYAIESVVWSPCGANLPLNINTEVRLSSQKPNQAGLLTNDSQDFKVTKKYRVQWRKC